MSRRLRAAGFLLMALLAAVLAATIANGYGKSVADGYGVLTPVVVSVTDLPAGRAITPEDASAALAVRRVPERFVPPGALGSPTEAVGLAPQAVLPAGSYLVAAQLQAPRRPAAESRLRGDRRAVEVLVSGAEALIASGPADGRRRVDVVVTAEPTGTGPGRTYIAVVGAPLLALRPTGEEGPGATAAATLALGRRQALRLIAAESFARRLTLLPAAR